MGGWNAAAPGSQQPFPHQCHRGHRKGAEGGLGAGKGDRRGKGWGSEVAGYQASRSGWTSVPLLETRSSETQHVEDLSCDLVPYFLPAVLSRAKEEGPCNLVGQEQEEGWRSVCLAEQSGSWALQGADGARGPLPRTAEHL